MSRKKTLEERGHGYAASLIELAWAAGMIEGEGCISYTGRPGFPELVLNVKSTDLDVLAHLSEVLPHGSICGPYCHPNRKPFYSWTASGWRAYAIVMTIYPFLGQRRRTAIQEKVRPWLAKPTWNGTRAACVHGHRYMPDNTFFDRAGRKRCRTCRILQGRERRKRESKKRS